MIRTSALSVQKVLPDERALAFHAPKFFRYHIKSQKEGAICPK